VSLSRRALLALSTSAWLRDRATNSTVVRRSVRRFMPGELLDDALGAAREQGAHGIATLLTHLGENVANPDQASAVARHYLDVIDRIQASGLDAQVSVKPTQLGLDFDRDACSGHLRSLLERAGGHEQLLWIDMESSPYVDRTLDLFSLACAASVRVGVALQAYLHRTADDLERLLPFAPAIRLVKGAYLEPADVAFSSKSDVDENYYRLGTRVLTAAAEGGPLVHLATHDPRLVDRLSRFATERGVPGAAYEYAMLYGIQRPLQRRLAAEGKRVRVLVAYGDNWFPWFMRRLAERPANLMLLARNLVGS
jgi:proline dehydrogenase